MPANLYSNIPEELRLLPNWVLWKFVSLEGKKPTKVPYHPNGYQVGAIEPSHWVTFEIAFNAFQFGGYDGLGFVFTNTPYSGIDLDDPSFLETGANNPDYAADLDRQIRIAKEFDSYSEVSPSGKGLHIIVKGEVPSGTNNRRAHVEIYSTGRYFTMTGVIYNNKPIADRNDYLNSLWSELKPKSDVPTIASQPETQCDEDILELARKHNAATFANLEAGIWTGAYPSQSEADQAYMNIIAYYTNNKEQCVRIFKASKLYRAPPVKDKKYPNRTVNTAFDQKISPLNFDKLKEELNGRVAQRLEPTAHNSIDVGSNPAATTISLPPGLMGEIAQFVYAYSTRPVPEISLAAAIGLMAGICGRAYNISGTGLNQYVLLLAMTGAGKEAMAEGIDRLMSEIKMQVPTSASFIGPAEISSGAALYKYLANSSQSFVSILGEFGLRIRQLASPNANGAEISLRRMILDLFTKSGHNRVMQASAYSKKEDSSSAISSPAFSILGESTPERFYEVLNEEMISEGLLPRFLLIEYKGRRVSKNTNKHNVAPNPKLIEYLASMAAHCSSINDSQPRRVINVQQTPAAENFLNEWNEIADSRINGSERDVLRQLWNRADLKALKLAALVAVGENFFEPTISLDTAKWAVELVKNDIATLTAKFEAGEIGGNTFEINQYKDMIRILKEYAAKDFSYVSKYQANEAMHKNKVISNTYLSLRLSKMASFRNDRVGGTVALKRTIQNLVDNGKLIVVSNADLHAKYSTTQKAFYIMPTVLDD